MNLIPVRLRFSGGGGGQGVGFGMCRGHLEDLGSRASHSNPKL